MSTIQSDRLVTIEKADLSAVIITALIASATYIGILEYRFRRVENHPLLRILRQIQEEQLLDFARRLIRGDRP